MKKHEKIIAICFILSFILVIISAIYTINQNKPSGNVYNIERAIKNIF